MYGWMSLIFVTDMKLKVSTSSNNWVVGYGSSRQGLRS